MSNPIQKGRLNARLKGISGGMAGLAAIALLAGCGGDGARSCNYITGGGTTAVSSSSASCTGCTFSNSGNAIDGNNSTFGTLNVPTVSAGSGVARATAQNGVVFGGGSTAGALVTVTSSASLEAGTSLVVRTYLNNVMQEETALGFNGVAGTGVNNADKAEVLSFKTSKAFNAVEFGISGTANNFSADIFEFCGG